MIGWQGTHVTVLLMMQLRSLRKRTLTTSVKSIVSERSCARTIDASENDNVVGMEVAREALNKKPKVTGQTFLPSKNDNILHRYDSLIPARLIRRYKRFLADVVLLNADQEYEGSSQSDETAADPDVITIYCPNTGPMVSLLDLPNARVQLSKSNDPKRKYAYTLEMIRIHVSLLTLY